MKRLAILLLICLILVGCAAEESPEPTVPPTETQIVTEPPIPWIKECGTPWNEDGSLTELHLTIPDAMHYNAALEFDGDLLLWSIDDHLENTSVVEMCLIELDDGTVAAEREISLPNFASPQILGSSIFLCDNYNGTILELNKKLETVNTWNIEHEPATFTMGNGGMLYLYDWNGTVTRLDLNTGEELPLLTGTEYIEYYTVHSDYITVEYYTDSGMKAAAVLDLITGDVLHLPLEGAFNNIYYENGIWLADTYRDHYVAYVCDASGEPLRADLEYATLQMLDDGNILCIWDDGCHISLHDSKGAALAQTTLTSTPYSYMAATLIPSQSFGGYFVVATDYASSIRLLYWDTSIGEIGDDIPFAPIPEPSEWEAALRQRARQLQETYGLTIFLGEDAETSFYDFEAVYVTDWELVDEQMDVLEDALQDYPEGFFRQLRYGDIHCIEIHLVGNLNATTAEYVHTYEAFVQYEYDRFVMGVDLYLVNKETYYHEFSHMIDKFLEWDFYNREDAVFSEDGWNSLNPSWFPGYSYDYSRELFLVDDESFVDSYSTINPTEDRARVLEYAMADYGSWVFDDREILREKLAYYCRCIRDAFDTTGWPDDLLWEQYLD